jgi:predicted metalloprotease with PDZ domain
VTLASAGERKGRNRLGVYDGGWVAAFCLDTDLRARSNGTKNLDDVMRLLYTNFGLTGRQFTLDDLQSAVEKVTGARFDDFLNRYVVGQQTIPVSECLRRAGYEGGGAGYDGDYFVTRRVASPYRTWVFKR